jgi:hypothetical protein
MTITMKKVFMAVFALVLFSLPGFCFALNTHFVTNGLSVPNAFYSPWSISVQDGLLTGSKVNKVSYIWNIVQDTVFEYGLNPAIGWTGDNLFAPPLIEHGQNGNPIFVHGRFYNGKNNDVSLVCIGGCATKNIIGAYDVNGQALWTTNPGQGDELLMPSTITSYEENGNKYYVLGAHVGNSDKDYLRVIKISESGDIIWITGAGIDPSFFNNEQYDGPAPSVGDVDGNGTNEILITGLANTYVLDGNGNVLFKLDEQGYGSPKFDGQRLYTRNSYGNGSVSAYAYNHATGDLDKLFTTGIAPSSNSSDEFTVCDLDNDGLGEIVLNGRLYVDGVQMSGHYAFAFDDDGTQLFASKYGNMHSPAPPICADIDGDNELEVVTGSRDGYVRGWEIDGEKTFELYISMDEGGNIYKDSPGIGVGFWPIGIVTAPLPDEDGPLHLVINGNTSTAIQNSKAATLVHELPYSDVRYACLTLGCNNQRNGQLVQFGEEVIPEDPANAEFLVTSSEAEENQSLVQIPVKFDVALSTPVTVGLTVNEASTSVPFDYSLQQETLTFEPGETEKFFTLNITQDNDYESSETVVFDLVIVEGNANLGVATQYTHTILNDDEVSQYEKWQFYWSCIKNNCIPLLNQQNYTEYRACALVCHASKDSYVPDEHWCGDPDGVDYFTPTTVTTDMYTSGKEDYCYTYPSSGKTYLFEGTCKNGKYVWIQKNCKELGSEYSCQAGACVPN